MTGHWVDAKDPAVLIRVKWSGEWLVGNEQIDKEHVELLKYGNDLVENSYKLTKVDEVIEHVDGFIERVRMHFQHEEAIMEALGFEKLEEHKLIHQKLLEEIDALRGVLKEHDGNLHELLLYLLNDVLVGHFESEDKILSSM